MSLTGAINAAQSGLDVTSRRAETTAANIANASTPGYVRRTVILGESIAGGVTTGVRTIGIERSTDHALTATRRDASSDLIQAETLLETWEVVSRRVGDSTASDGLFARAAEFEAALSNAALTPESETQLHAVFDSAQQLVSTLHDLASLTASVRMSADQRISEGVASLNESLQRVERLNGQIARSSPASVEAAALRDDRQRALDTIASYLPIQVVERESGTIEVLTREGVFLVAGRAKTIEFEPTPAFDHESTLSNGILSGLVVDGVDITPGGTTYGAISSGALGALFLLRDNDVPAFAEKLDAFADDLISRLSADQVDTTKASGAPGLFIDPLAGTVSGQASRIALNAAIDPTQGGEIRRIRDGIGTAAPGIEGHSDILSEMLSAVRSTDTITGAGLTGRFSTVELAAHLSSLAGQQRLASEAAQASAAAQHAILVDSESATTGVDVDQQLQELLLVEQAYAANARVLSVVGQLLNQLLEI